MKVKIISSESPSYWYASRIGEIFEVEQCPYNPKDWRCEEESGSIVKTDTEVVKESNKKPHKWVTEIHAYADGFKIESKPVDCGDWLINNNPNWGDVGMEYRVSKEPEFPETTLTGKELHTMFYAESDPSTEAYVRIANHVLKEFVTSGQMDAYIKERDNAA